MTENNISEDIRHLYKLFIFRIFFHVNFKHINIHTR